MCAQYQFGLEPWDALADIDWRTVGQVLCEHGFVREPGPIMSEDHQLAVLRHAIKEYLQSIAGHPSYVDHMMGLKETYPRWVGPSHLVDPRDGLPIWPPESAP